MSSGLVEVDARDIEACNKAGFSKSEIDLALQENKRQDPTIEHLMNDFLSGNDTRRVLPGDPVCTDSYHNLAYEIAESYCFSALNQKLRVWDWSASNEPSARVTKDSSGMDKGVFPHPHFTAL